MNKSLLTFCNLAASTVFSGLATAAPNVLFIAIDDQNDWIGHLGGHPMAQTPNIDRLAERATTFLNAHCQAPLCNPSRTSVLLGLRPTTTGIYGLDPWFREVPGLEDRITLPQYFAQQGYRTLGAGKIFHHGGTGKPSTASAAGKPGRIWPKEFDRTGPRGGPGIRPEEKLIGPTPMGNNPWMDWGCFPHNDEDKGDYQVASWAVEQIRSAPSDQPFFLATGFFLPHVPCYATQEWFDLYPDDDSVLPPIRLDDRDDTPRFSWYLHWELPEPRLKWVRENDQWRNLVRSYLACISFMDAQVGRVLDALTEEGLLENTVIVLWGDQGYHLGEKIITGKNTLWEPSTRVPLVFAGPGMKAGQRCAEPVELLDIFPTLIDLCGLDKRSDLEGLSLVPQLNNPLAERTRPAITTQNQGNHTIRTDRWRYIRYADGSEELYDLQTDPNEWVNLAGNPQYASIAREHRQWLPVIDASPAPGSAHRVLTYDPETDVATWQGKAVKRSDPITQ